MERGAIKKKCLLCNTIFHCYLARIRQSKGKYCSKECANTSFIGKRRLPIGYKHSEEVRNKISEIQKGTKKPWVVHKSGNEHYLWIEDRTKIVGRHNRNMHDADYKQWRKVVWERDNYVCRINSEDCNGRIEAHHILGWSIYPELRYEFNNGITLCQAHHPKKRAEEKRLIPFFQGLVPVSNV